MPKRCVAAGLRRSGLGKLWHVKHKFVFKKVGSEEWFLALDYFQDSTVVAWPCEYKKFNGTEVEYLQLASPAAPKFFAVFDLREWHGASVTPRSWLWQTQNMPGTTKDVTPGTRLVVSGPEGPIIEVAAREAFWSLGMSFLGSLAAVPGLGLQASASSSSGSLLAVLMGLVMQNLQIGEEEALKICAKRFANNDIDMSYADGLLNMDDALQLLDKSDQERIQQEQQHVRSEQTSLDNFTKEYTEKKRSIGGSAAKRPRTGPKAGKVLVPACIRQADAKKFIPPGTSIWVGNTSQSWNGHCPPRRRIYAPWKNYDEGEAGAVKNVIYRLWQQYSALNGLDMPNVVEFSEPAVGQLGKLAGQGR